MPLTTFLSTSDVSGDASSITGCSDSDIQRSEVRLAGPMGFPPHLLHQPSTELSEQPERAPPPGLVALVQDAAQASEAWETLQDPPSTVSSTPAPATPSEMHTPAQLNRSGPGRCPGPPCIPPRRSGSLRARSP